MIPLKMSKNKPLHPPSELLNTISIKYVNKDFQERFLVEALQRTSKLTFRICHHLSTVLSEHIGNEQEECIDLETPCWMLNGIWTHKEWKDFSKERAYGGIMIIPDDGSFVYAKKE